MKAERAKSRRLFDMMCKGSFREDLYYRLAGHELLLPPLRERRGDIPDLASELLRKIGHCGRLSQGARAGLLARDYPGNARELRHTLEKAAASCPLPPLLQKHFETEAQQWLSSGLLLLPPALTRRNARTHERVLLLCLISTHAFSELPHSIHLRVARLFARGWSEAEGGAPLRALAKAMGREPEDTLSLVRSQLGTSSPGHLNDSNAAPRKKREWTEVLQPGAPALREHLEVAQGGRSP